MSITLKTKLNFKKFDANIIVSHYQNHDLINKLKEKVTGFSDTLPLFQPKISNIYKQLGFMTLYHYAKTLSLYYNTLSLYFNTLSVSNDTLPLCIDTLS
jgi:hypothetical protein